jgi:hypothetical protein
MIAVHAKHLEAGGIIIVSKPLIEFVTTESPDLFSMLLAIVVDVIKSKNKRFINSTPLTTITAVFHDRLALKAVIIIESGFTSSFRIGFYPIDAALVELVFVCSIIRSIVFTNGLSRGISLALMASANAVFTFVSIPTLCRTDAIELLQRQPPKCHGTRVMVSVWLVSVIASSVQSFGAMPTR